MCLPTTACVQHDDFCTYSGGKSRRYFSAECLDCKCVVVPNLRHKPHYLMHEKCASASTPTKCGATQARIGDDVWNLEPLDLKVNECGRCVLALQASHRWGTCQVTKDVFSEFTRLSKHYTLIDSGSELDFCCKKYQCQQDYACSPEEPCRGYECPSNAVCKEKGEVGSKQAACYCREGFGPTDDGADCVPNVPDGSRCCTAQSCYMWVPPEYLDDYVIIDLGWFFTMSTADKKICPKIGGVQWSHATNQLCDRDGKSLRFVYRGDRRTPLHG